MMGKKKALQWELPDRAHCPLMPMGAQAERGLRLGAYRMPALHLGRWKQQLKQQKVANGWYVMAPTDCVKRIGRWQA